MSQVPIAARIALTGGADFWHSHAVEGAGLPQVMLTDGPHGVRKQAGTSDHVGLNDSEPATCFPPAVGLSATWDPGLLYRVGEALGRECRALGVGILLGPGINLKRSPLCGRNFEYFSEDPYLTGALASAFVAGVQSQGVGTSLKHFAANNQETDRMRRDSQVDERTLRELYLRAFATVVTTAHPWTVMCSYNRVNGTRASESEFLLTQVLRKEWGFGGFVVSDWGAVHDRARSLKAGLDLEMPASQAHEDALLAAFGAGEIDEATIDTAYHRVEQVLRRAAATLAQPFEGFDVEAHHGLAREVAGQAVVLLANDGILPLAPATRVAVVGEFARTPRYQGAGSSRVNPTRLDDALSAITALADAEVSFAPGFTTAEDQQLPADAHEQAVAAAAAADVVLAFLGLGESHESEGYDRTTMDLPAEQLALLDAILAVNDNVVVVLSNGASVLLPFAGRVRAVVEGWLLGQAGGSALAEVLYGLVNPSGKLAETIPLRESDVPSYLHFPGDETGVRYGEGLFMGYRGYDALDRDVAFPFGHGLSYTTFEYSDLAVTGDTDAIRVAVTVTNTGTRVGREVVQAYVAVPESKVVRVPRELKGFAAITLGPGASGRVEILIEPMDLEYYSVLDRDWLVEPGRYQVWVGSSSRDLRASATVSLVGEEHVRRMTLESTLGEALAFPLLADAITPLVAEVLGADTGEDVMRMLSDFPLSTIASFTGRPAAEFQDLLDEVNAGR